MKTSYIARIALLFGLMFALMMLCTALIYATSSLNLDLKTCTYIGLVLQALLVFTLPPLLMCLVFREQASEALCLSRGFTVKAGVAAAVLFLLALPAMNALVAWNEGITLPASMKGLETLLRTMEDTAQITTNLLVKTTDVWQLALNLLVVAFLAGFSEELFYRAGIVAPLLDKGKSTVHTGVWVCAFVFSASHFQFYGFFPRFVLGAWLGYLLVWSRSLWLPIFFHTLNNGVVVLFTFLQSSKVTVGNWADIGSNAETRWVAAASLVATLIFITIAVKSQWFAPKQQPARVKNIDTTT